MSGVPLKAMCSIMWARPVSWSGSCAEPASTRVKNENTGASGRRQRTTVKPLGRVFTETRFSYDARSCATSGKAATSRSRQVNLANQRFIVPPDGNVIMHKLKSYAGKDVQVKPRRAGALRIPNGISRLSVPQVAHLLAQPASFLCSANEGHNG